MATKLDRILLVDSGTATGERVRPAAANGTGGLEIVEVSEDESFAAALSRGEFDLVLTEEEIGWTVGYEILRRVKGTRPEVPVILLRESPDVSSAVEAVRAGFENCVTLDDAGLTGLRGAIQAALSRTRDHQHATRRTTSVEGTLQRLKVGFYRLSAEGEILVANRRCLDLLALPTPAEARRFNLHDRFFHRDVADGLIEELKRQGMFSLTEVLVRRADGVVERVCVSESAGKTAAGEAIVDGIMLEPSRHPGDQVPMAVAARVHVTLGSLPMVLAILDRFGHIVWIRGRDLGAMGIDPDDCVGRMLTVVGRMGGNLMDDVCRALGGEAVSDTLRIDDRMFRVRMSALRGSRAVAPEVAMVAMEVSGANGGLGSQTRFFNAAPVAEPAPPPQSTGIRCTTAILPAVRIPMSATPASAEPGKAEATPKEQQEVAN